MDPDAYWIRIILLDPHPARHMKKVDKLPKLFTTECQYAVQNTYKLLYDIFATDEKDKAF